MRDVEHPVEEPPLGVSSGPRRGRDARSSRRRSSVPQGQSNRTAVSCRVAQRGTAGGPRAGLARRRCTSGAWEWWREASSAVGEHRCSLKIGRAVDEACPGPRNPWGPRETICEPSDALPLLHLIHEADQLVDHLFEILAAPFHGADLVTNPREHIVHLGRGVRRVLFGARVTVPLLHVDSPRDFSRADALTEREYTVRIVLKRRYVIAAHGDFARDKDRRERLVYVNLWNGSPHTVL